jgi:hypothetical protein
MKKILTIASLFSFFLLFSQNNIAKRIQSLQSEKAIFRNFKVLNVTQDLPSDAINNVVSNATFANVDLAVVNQIVASKPSTIELDIPYNNEILKIELYQVDLFAEGFHVDSDKSQNIPYEKGVYYRGIVKGDYTSVASFNFFNNEFNGVVSATGLSNVVVGKLDKSNNVENYMLIKI